MENLIVKVLAETGNMPTDLGVSEERQVILGEAVQNAMDEGRYPVHILSAISKEVQSPNELAFICFAIGGFYQSVDPIELQEDFKPTLQ